jgi:hypothetical protein
MSAVLEIKEVNPDDIDYIEEEIWKPIEHF